MRNPLGVSSSSTIRSAAHPVAQVQHPVAPDHHVRVLQQVLAVHRPEVPLAGPEHHRDDVHRHLVHQAEREGLPADVARRYRHGALPGELLRLRDGLLDIVDEVVRRLRVPPVRLGPVRHHDHVLPRRRPALPAVRHVEQVPSDHHRPDAVPRRTDVVVRRLRDPHPARRRLVHLASDERMVAVEVPVEQRADLVVLVGDVAVHRHYVVHHHSAHHFSYAGLFLQNYLRTLVFGYPKTVYRQNRHHGRGCSERRESSVPLGWGYPKSSSVALSGPLSGPSRSSWPGCRAGTRSISPSSRRRCSRSSSVQRSSCDSRWAMRERGSVTPYSAECVEKINSSKFAVSWSRQSFYLGPLAPPTAPSWSRRGVY